LQGGGCWLRNRRFSGETEDLGLGIHNVDFFIGFGTTGPRPSRSKEENLATKGAKGSNAILTRIARICANWKSFLTQLKKHPYSQPRLAGHEQRRGIGCSDVIGQNRS
jgi:hypothetical protein